jgi:tellurite resistance protein TerC
MNFPFGDYWHIYAIFTSFVLLLVFFDMGLLSKSKQNLTTKQALIWSGVWISIGVLVGVVIWQYANMKFGPVIGNQIGLEYFSGFLIEKALAVDNIFVFVLVFTSLAIPKHLQRKVLGYGILGALFFRAIFISIGAVLIQYKFMLYIFGAFLIFTGIKMVIPTDAEKNLADTKLYKFLKRYLPLTPELKGEKFWVVENGKRLFTPLFLALVLIELSDIVFAIDSVPAIFAITKEPFIVFTSNMMAILGLRSLYMVLADAVHRFEYLKYGLAFILVFVGLKMVWLNDMFGGHFPIGLSLAIIAAAVVTSVVVSLYKSRELETAEHLK